MFSTQNLGCFLFRFLVQILNRHRKKAERAILARIQDASNDRTQRRKDRQEISLEAASNEHSPACRSVHRP